MAAYYQSEEMSYNTDTLSLPKDATVVVCVSYLPVVIQLGLCLAMMLFLRELARRKLQGYMPLVGSNSLAISAACRVSPLSRIPGATTSDNGSSDIELEDLSSQSAEDPEGGRAADTEHDIALFPLKWGEVKMPEEWYLQNDEPQETGQVGHLGFGTAQDDPQPPTNGRRYR